MYKSIFTRLLATYLLLTILVTGSLAMLLSHGFKRYIFMEKDRVLSAAALKVESVVDRYYQGELSQNELQIALDNLGYITDSTIYALKVDKTTLYNSQNRQLEAELAEGYLLEDLQKILEGENIYRKKLFSKILDTEVVFKGTPLRVDQQIIGAVLIFSPLSEITTYLVKINSLIAGTALAAIIISFFFIFITAARISRPIREMERAARQLAAGEAAQDLAVHTGDELERLADSFNYMKKQLESTENMRREFIGNVSHDLRTPLTSINGFVQGMLDGLVQPAQYHKYLSLMQDETQRLMRLTGDILELAKIQSGNIKLNKKAISIRDTLEKIVGSAGLAQGLNNNITITIDCDPQLQVQADPDRFRQIVGNIISNALRFTENVGSVAVQVREQKEWVEFIIKDTGAGINQEDLPYIFERFYRGDKSRRGQEGTGLGLCIVKNLVDLHGGYIRAESRAGV